MILVLATGVGCGQKAEGPDLTGGVELRLAHRGQGNALATFDLAQDGTLTYSGGADARNDLPTWSGQLTAEQAASVVELARAAGWFESAPERGDKKDPTRWEVELSAPGVDREFVAFGDRAEIRAVYDRLEQLARARFDAYLQTLPKPGEQRK
jgi:hypothetical protein